MHSSYFFLRQIRNALSKVLERAILVDAYRQSLQSVVFVFEKTDGEYFYIEGFFGSDECLLHFPKEQSKSRKAVSVFKELYGLTITSIEQAENERAFAIHLKGKQSLVFKWFGRQSNILHWDEGKVKGLLNSKLKNDEQFDYSVFHKPRAWSEEEFVTMDTDLNKFIPQLGKEVIKDWANYVHWNDVTNAKDKWLKVQALLHELKSPTYYILKSENRARFSLFYFKQSHVECLAEERDPLLAANLYFQYYYRFNRVEILREQLMLFYTNKQRALNKQIVQLSQAVVTFDELIPPNQLADIIMANLTIFKVQREAKVLNFYTEENITVKLKDRLSAVDYASLLYKKSKNRQTEKIKLLDRLAKLDSDLTTLTQAFQNIELADSRTLLTLKEDFLPLKGMSPQQEKALEPPVFKEYDCLGYKIYVGRNAKNNDELTLHFAHKEDLWLHAKDVSGSHVVIKHKANKVFPKPVLERAAELAAFYSKRKNDSLCPVMYTLKKYVRKVKGTAAGMVRVEKESVLLVVPAE